MNEQHEKEIIRRFILPSRKSRYEFALPRIKHRYAALVKLFANDEIDLRFAEKGGDVVSFLALSSVCKNAECYIMSCDEESDGRAVPFEEAMKFAGDASFGILIYCPKQQVAYYKGEQGDEYILYNSS